MQIWIQKLLPQHLLSRLMGKLARCRVSWLKNSLIRLFIKYYKVNMFEAFQEDYHMYTNFNTFFTRPLKPNVRPQPKDPALITSPVDGYISEFGYIQDQQLFQAKGHSYRLMSLFGGDDDMTRQFHDGAFMTLYLSPKDYHRVHMPMSGTLKKMIHVPGVLFSVNPDTVNNVPNLFARNERVICFFDSSVGLMAVIMVGAMIVASMATTWHGIVAPSTRSPRQQWNYENHFIQLNRGDEMGHFEVGSTTIVLFSKEAVCWTSSLAPGQAIQLGQTIGSAVGVTKPLQ